MKSLKRFATLLLVAACSGKVVDIGTNQKNAGGAGAFGSSTSSSVSGGAPYDPDAAFSACDLTSKQAGALLTSFCAPCHANGDASLGVPTFKDVLNVAKMIDPATQTDRPDVPFIVPGYPERSRIYQRVSLGEMPNTNVIPQVRRKLTTSEVSVLQYWIASCLGVTATGATATGPGGSGATTTGTGSGGTAGAGGSSSNPPPIDAGAAEDAGEPQRDASDTSCGISYPAIAFIGENVLFPSDTGFRSTSPDYELAADLGADASLSVRITLQSGTPWLLSDASGWLSSRFDSSTGKQDFLARASGRDEIRFAFQQSGSAKVEYFECGSPAPTRTKIINWVF
jgi:hypothetical protein